MGRIIQLDLFRYSPSKTKPETIAQAAERLLGGMEARTGRQGCRNPIRYDAGPVVENSGNLSHGNGLSDIRVSGREGMQRRRGPE